jgi:hypothetical protein
MSAVLGRWNAERLLTIAALAAAVFFLVTALCAMANFALRQPMFDQLRLYHTYLTLPFPHNAWQLENGHRPILPALVRLAEIVALQANQWLQIGFGLVCALGTAGIVAACGWRERTLAAPLRATAVLAAVAAVFWLANARVLMHGHEIVHAHLLTASVSVAALCVWRAHVTRTRRWVVAATVACAAGTFTFGAGIASFVAVLVLGVLLRLPRRWSWIPLAGLVLCLFVYLCVLPGDGAVREMITLRPLDSALVAARWLASPWITGWLGLADPPLYDWLGANTSRTGFGAVLRGTANMVDAIPGADWRTTTSALIGFAGLAALAWAVIGRLRRWERPTRLETVALVLGLFAASCAGVIGLGRVDYLHDHPDQVFADRYLVWPCLFWLSLGLLGLSRLARRGARAWIGAVLGLSLVLPLLPTHRLYAGWAAAVSQRAERFAAAVRSGVVDAATLPPAADAPASTVIATLALLRERRLAMFAGGWLPPGAAWSGPVTGEADASARLLASEALVDAADARIALHFSGVLDDSVRARADAPLAILDAQRRLCGYAQLSFIRPGARALRLDVPARRGFDGYIAGYRSDETYELVFLDTKKNVATRLLRLRDGAVATDSPAVP